LQGLAAMHAEGLLHLDIKPTNVFLTDRGVAKVGDYGISRRISELIEDGGRREGTPGYMAPEQISGGEVDARTDLYAVGVLARELLGGEPPSTEAVWVGRALAADPADRFPSARDMAAALTGPSPDRTSTPRSSSSEWSDGMLSMLGMKKAECPGCGSKAVLRKKEPKWGWVVVGAAMAIAGATMFIVPFFDMDDFGVGILLIMLGLAIGTGGGFVIHAGASHELRTCRDCNYEHRGNGWSQSKVWGG
jgi:hypothetical protein